MITTRMAYDKYAFFEQVGLNLHYLDWPGIEPAILLLHPTQMNGHIWDRTITMSGLPNRFIAPDQRGHGRSDYPSQGYHVDDYLADDLALADELDLREFILVGGATGGNIALLLASRYPERVRGLVVVNPALNPDETMIARMQAKVRDRFRFPTFEDAVESMLFAERWEQDVLQSYARQSFVRTPDGMVEWRCSQQGLLETYGSLAMNFWTLIDVGCPTLIVRGPDSPVFSEGDMLRLQAAIPGATSVTLDGTGQLAMQDDPVAFASCLDGFVRRL